MSDQQKWTGAKIDEQLFDAINTYAATKGKHPKYIIPELLKAGLIARMQEEKDAPDDIQLWLAVEKQQEAERRFNYLGTLAYYALRNEDQVALDKVADFCTRFDIPLETVIESVNLTSGSPPLSIVDSPTGVDACKHWLSETLAYHGELPSNYVSEHAALRGFSNATLKTAKSQLGDLVQSERRSRKWFIVWRGPKHDEQKSAYLAQFKEAIGAEL